MKRLDKKEMKLVASSGAVSSVQTACYFPIMLGHPRQTKTTFMWWR
jgi:hypothetical protein